MRRDWLVGIILALVVVAIGASGCRTALQVQVRTYECRTEAREGSSIILRDCRVTDDDKQGEGAPAADQAGDDDVNVQPKIRAYVPIGPTAIAIVRYPTVGRGRPRRKIHRPRQTRVQGYRVKPHLRALPRRRRRR